MASINKQKPIPKLRGDLSYKEVQDNGQKFIILFDQKGYAKQPISIPENMILFFRMLDGSASLEMLEESLAETYGSQAEMVIEPFAKLLNYMDLGGYLESENFKRIKTEMDNYLSLTYRPPVCAGFSYPDTPEELEEELQNIFSSVDSESAPPGAKAISAPHIDFRIGRDSHKAYAAAYHALRGNEPDLFVILGTSHYGASGPFMFSEKNYKTPLGIVETDKEILSELMQKFPEIAIIDEMAHKPEHSIEFHVVLLQSYFKNIDFKILPILTGSFHQYMMNGESPDKDKYYKEFISGLDAIIKKTGKKAAYIASGDLSHIGRKFDDPFDAAPELPRLEKEDGELIEALEQCDKNRFFQLISEAGDKNKICGLSPFYSLLELSKPQKGRFLKYSQWNEAETKSAVSYATIAYY